MSSPAGERLVSVDVARGLAVLLMIQTHAYDGWVQASERAGLAFRLTRVLGTLPLPMFLLLAGMGLSLRFNAAARKGQAAGPLRSEVTRSALTIVGVGYALSMLYALLDGSRGLETLLRADVLHAIGLSLTVMAWVAISPGLFASRVTLAGVILTIIPVLACPWLTRVGSQVEGPSRFFWGLWIDVPSVTRMPVIPLLSFCATGVLLGRWLVHREAAPPRRFALYLCALGLLLLCAGALGEAEMQAAGVPMSRAEPSIAFNVLDLDGRAFIAIGLSLLASPMLGWARTALVACGRHSLLVYGLHLPFCYGGLARPIKRSLDMTQASFFLALLCATCIAVALIRAHWQRLRSKRLS